MLMMPRSFSSLSYCRVLGSKTYLEHYELVVGVYKVLRCEFGDFRVVAGNKL